MIENKDVCGGRCGASGNDWDGTCYPSISPPALGQVFYCTLPQGHKGEHIACADGACDVLSWDNEGVEGTEEANPLAPDGVTRLAQWYASQCNGEWEHSNGLTIVTTDNPGWVVEFYRLNGPCVPLKVKRGDVELEIHEHGQLTAFTSDPAGLDSLLLVVAEYLPESL